DSAWSVLSTKDGSVWLGARRGFNRWKNGLIIVNGAEAPADRLPLSLFQDDRGRVWTPTFNGGAYFENGRLIPVKSLPKGQVHNIAQDSSGSLFFGYDEALVELRKDGVVQSIQWSALGRKSQAAVQISDPVQGGIWIGFIIDGGIAH